MTSSHASQRGTLRPRPPAHAGRRQLPGPRVRLRGRDPAVHGLRQGPVPDRRRRRRVRGPGLLLGPGAAGACPPGRPRRRARRRRPRAVLRCVDPGRGQPRRHRPGTRPGRRARPDGLHRHRGDHDGRPAGPRLHRPEPHHQVRRLLPRPPGRAPRRRPAPASPLWRCPARPASPPPPPPRRSCCPTTTSTPSKPPSPSTATTSPPSSPRRRRPTWAWSPRARASTPGWPGSPANTARC